MKSRPFNLFAMDDWRPRSNLTLNVGVRYELLSPYTENSHRMVNLDVTPDFSAASPVTAGGSGPFTGSFPDALLETDTNNIAPRVGVAWRAARGLVVRGGYGVSFNNGSYLTIARQLASQPPFAVTNTQIGSVSSMLFIESALAATSANTTNTFGIDRSYALGRVQTGNIDLSRTLRTVWVVGGGYTHTRGSSLDIIRAPNRNADGSLRIAGVQPFLWQTAEGESVLDAATFRIQRRLTHGMGGRAVYTLARSRDNSPSIGGTSDTAAVVAQNDQDLDTEWGLSNFDRRHRLTADLTIELPFGPDRRWLTNGGVWARLLDGWRMTTTFQAESGTPLTARVQGAVSDVAQGVTGALRADYNGAGIAIENPAVGRFFNTDAFSVPAPGRFGTTPRNNIIGPGSRQLDAQLARDVRLSGTRALTMQVRATNVLNLVNYQGVVTYVNSPTFGQVQSVRAMRSVQLNARFRF